MHPGELARAGNAKARSRELPCVMRRHVEVQQAQAGDLTQLEQISGHRGQHRRDVRADVVDRKCNLDLCAVEKGRALAPVDDRAVQ